MASTSQVQHDDDDGPTRTFCSILATPLGDVNVEHPIPIENAHENTSCCRLHGGEVHVSMSVKHPERDYPAFNLDKQRSNWRPCFKLYDYICDAADAANEKAIETRNIIDGIVFCKFIMRKFPNSDQGIVKGLVERWWPTTHSFHFPNFELGFTPLDFYMLSGTHSTDINLTHYIKIIKFLLSFKILDTLNHNFSGIPVGQGGATELPIYSDFELKRESEILMEFFPGHNGVVRIIKTRINQADVENYIRGSIYTEGISALRIARVFAFFVLGTVFFPDAGNRLLTGLLKYVENLNKINDYDWGSAFMARLYAALDMCATYKSPRRGAPVRQRSLSTVACWQFLEIFAYEYIDVLCPYIKTHGPEAFPVLVRYGYANKRHMRGYARFNYTIAQNQIEMRSIPSVQWRPYVDMHEYGSATSDDVFEKATERFLLRDIQLGGYWYLGERFSRQLEGRFHIPTTPPSTMARLPYYHVDYFRNYNFPRLKRLCSVEEYGTWWATVGAGALLQPLSRQGNIDSVGYHAIGGPEIPCMPSELVGTVYQTQIHVGSSGASTSVAPSGQYIPGYSHTTRFPDGSEQVLLQFPRPSQPVVNETQYYLDRVVGKFDQLAVENYYFRHAQPSPHVSGASGSHARQTSPVFPTQALGDPDFSGGSYHPAPPTINDPQNSEPNYDWDFYD